MKRKYFDARLNGFLVMVAVTGTGSGIDIDGLVASLVGAERVPLETALNAKEANITQTSSSLVAAKSAVSNLEMAANKLADATTFSKFTPTVSDPTKLSASVTSSAAAGSYQLTVSSLASAQTLSSGNFSATSDTLGTGTLTIALGSPVYTGNIPDTYASFTQSSAVDITIDSSNNTLAGIRDAINASNAGVNASILKNGSNYQLLMVAENTGLANSLSISVSGDSSGTDEDASGLSQLVYNASVSRLQQSSAGSDASFAINGLAVTSSSNTVNDLIDGVSVNLLSTTTSAVTLDIDVDTSAVVREVESFVESYNEYATLFKDLTKYDSTTGISGPLQGDSTVRSIMSRVRNEIAVQVDGLNGSFRSLSDVGISIDKSGAMSFSESTFNTAFKSAPSEVSAIFAKTTHSGVEVEGVAEKLETLMEGFLITGGVFDLRINSLNSQLTDLNDERSTLARRMQALENRYFAQLNAMDSLIAEIETTGNFLTQQFEAMKPRKD